MITQNGKQVKKIIVTSKGRDLLVTYEAEDGVTYDRNPSDEVRNELMGITYSGEYPMRPVLTPDRTVGFEIILVCESEGCYEPIYRDFLCYRCFVEQETADWDARDAERRSQREEIGYIFGDPALDGAWYGDNLGDVCL